MKIIKRFDHVSIGVKDPEKARKFFTEVMGGSPLKDHGHSDRDNFGWWTFGLGGQKIELVHSGDPESGVGRYIEKYGEGYHHISIGVENIEEAQRYFESKGVRVLGLNTEKATWKHFYLHPKDTFGAMIQVFEDNEEAEDLGKV